MRSPREKREDKGESSGTEKEDDIQNDSNEEQKKGESDMTIDRDMQQSEEREEIDAQETNKVND